jgi:mono/diheme cytochrome c family protein
MRGFSAALILGVALIGLASGASAQKRGGDAEAAKLKNPVAASPASVAAGQKLYATFCRHCHGVRGLGDGPLAPRNPRPPNLTDGNWEFGSTDGEIFAVIKHGAGEDSQMKPSQPPLSDTDIWHVVNFLRSIGPKADSE